MTIQQTITILYRTSEPNAILFSNVLRANKLLNKYCHHYLFILFLYKTKTGISTHIRIPQCSSRRPIRSMMKFIIQLTNRRGTTFTGSAFFFGRFLGLSCCNSCRSGSIRKIYLSASNRITKLMTLMINITAT